MSIFIAAIYHCLSFANATAYGTKQEGIVIKNQTALEQERGPHILKYVNPEFKETQKNHKMKLEDPNKIERKSRGRRVYTHDCNRCKGYEVLS